VKQRNGIDRLILEGLVEETKEKLSATPIGRLFIRVIASVFDAYLKSGMYSKVV
jgi:coproporphyrinogen III oxidase-like Fe-S oxidoreductase